MIFDHEELAEDGRGSASAVGGAVVEADEDTRKKLEADVLETLRGVGTRHVDAGGEGSLELGDVESGDGGEQLLGSLKDC